MTVRILLILALLSQQLLAWSCPAFGQDQTCRAIAATSEDGLSCCCGSDMVAACECQVEQPAPQTQWQPEAGKLLALPAATVDLALKLHRDADAAVGVNHCRRWLSAHERCVLLCRWLK
jgi:hypothetical protein